MSAPANRSCQECGGSITAEQIARREAGLVRGVLLCATCVSALRRQAQQAAATAQAATVSAATAPPPAVPAAQAKPVASLDDPISLVETEAEGNRPSGMIRSLAGHGLSHGAREDHFKRSLGGPTDPPTRCRTFHGKLTDASIQHLDEQINEWLDANPEVYVKHVTTTVGPFEGKHVEQHLIVNLFY